LITSEAKCDLIQMVKQNEKVAVVLKHRLEGDNISYNCYKSTVLYKTHTDQIMHNMHMIEVYVKRHPNSSLAGSL